jgi:dihydropteroate synthase
MMIRPALVGIVNVTPDSFSDGGRLNDAAIAHAKTLMEEGADILDIGAESTRPGATLLSPDEEWVRLEPVLGAIAERAHRAEVRLSVDTRHAQTAARAIELGVQMINDQGGLEHSAMVEIIGEHECDVVVMHSLGLPANPKVTLPVDTLIIDVMLAWKKQMVARATAAGIAPERLIFDPGLGFGKTTVQSLELVLNAAELVDSGGRWLFGHSRKSFLTLFTNAEPAERDSLTLTFSAQLAAARVPYLRIHNVEAHRTMFEKLCT